MVKKAEKCPKTRFFRKKICILRSNLGNKVVSNNLFCNTYLRYSILGKIIKVKVTLEPIILEKRAEKCKKHTFSL